MSLPVAFVIRVSLYYVTVYVCVRMRGRASNNRFICMRVFKDMIISTLECKLVLSVNDPLISIQRTIDYKWRTQRAKDPRRKHEIGAISVISSLYEF